MDEQGTWALLEQLGAARRGHFELGKQHADTALGPLEPLAKPKAASDLANELAARLPDPKPDVVLVWAGLPSVLLGFVVGIALERRVVRLADDEGVVYGSAELKSGERVALVGEVLTERQVRLARAFVENSGARLASVAALVDDGRAGELIALVSMEGHRFPAESCPLCQRNQPLQALAGSQVGAPNGLR